MKAPKASKYSKKVWAGALCAMSAIILSAAPAIAAAPTKAAPVKTTKQYMTYDVYAGGFHVVSSNLTVDLSQKSRYWLKLGAYTHGMLAKLAPWEGVFETKGWYNAKASAGNPEIHRSDTIFRDEQEINEFVYNKDGSYKEFRQFNKNKNGAQPPQPELSDGTTDVLTSTLMVMNKIAQGGECEGSDKIFDGSRSYILHFSAVGEVTVPKSDLNVYTGPAVECTVEVKPLKGKWHEKPRGWMSIQEQGREKGTMPTIWLAKLAPGEPAVPVKIRVKTEYGTLFMHLTGYKGGGKTLALEK